MPRPPSTTGTSTDKRVWTLPLSNIAPTGFAEISNDFREGGWVAVKSLIKSTGFCLCVIDRCVRRPKQ
jgi:hypothetical protein